MAERLLSPRLAAAMRDCVDELRPDWPGPAAALELLIDLEADEPPQLPNMPLHEWRVVLAVLGALHLAAVEGDDLAAAEQAGGLWLGTHISICRRFPEYALEVAGGGAASEGVGSPGP